ncbi:hypothetical protein [Enterocloster sp. OA13]
MYNYKYDAHFKKPALDKWAIPDGKCGGVKLKKQGIGKGIEER